MVGKLVLSADRHIEDRQYRMWSHVGAEPSFAIQHRRLEVQSDPRISFISNVVPLVFLFIVRLTCDGTAGRLCSPWFHPQMLSWLFAVLVHMARKRVRGLWKACYLHRSSWKCRPSAGMCRQVVSIGNATKLGSCHICCAIAHKCILVSNDCSCHTRGDQSRF